MEKIASLTIALAMLTSCASGDKVGEQRSNVGAGTCDWDPSSETCICTASPIIFDLAGDGIHLTSAEGGVPFQLRPNRLPEQWAWTELGTDDAWLVMDRNHNGLIDDGTEMFGDQATQGSRHDPNGFSALAEFDDNHDGAIDASDKVWSELRLWNDKNHDGGSMGELLSLDDVGISSISLNYTPTSITDAHGNELKYASSITAAAPVGGAIYDVWLRRGEATSARTSASNATDPSYILHTCWAWSYATYNTHVLGPDLSNVWRACNHAYVQNDPLVGRPNGSLGQLARLVARFSTSTLSEADALSRVQNIEIASLCGSGSVYCLPGGPEFEAGMCEGGGAFPDPDPYMAPPYVGQNYNYRVKCTTTGGAGGGDGGGQCFAGSEPPL